MFFNSRRANAVSPLAYLLSPYTIRRLLFQSYIQLGKTHLNLNTLQLYNSHAFFLFLDPNLAILKSMGTSPKTDVSYDDLHKNNGFM